MSALASQFVTLSDAAGAQAVVAPDLGGWLLRYSRNLPGLGPIEALHFDPAVVERYPKEMWAGSPLLFPLVSHNRVGGKPNHYAWAGQEFPMPQHGFARRVPWKVIEQSVSALTMEMSVSPDWQAAYPFQCKHRFTYRLEAGQLHWLQVIENEGENPIPFSTGVHPYLAVPLGLKGCRQECYVEVPACQKLEAIGEFERFEPSPFPAQHWSVAQDVSGTMLLSEMSRRELALVDPFNGVRVRLNWEDAPQHRFAAIWSHSTEAPFYCLEPWTALPNSFAREDGELIVLPPGQHFRAAMWMEVQPFERG